MEQSEPSFPLNPGQLLVWLRDTDVGRVVVRDAVRSFLEKGSLSEILDSTPPHDLGIERRLIGMLIIYPETINEVSRVIRPGNFHADANRRLFEHLIDMRGSTDMTLLVAQLREKGEMKRIGGAAYLAEAIYDHGMPSLAKHYCKVLLDHARRRAVIRTADRMLVHAYAARMPVFELIEKTLIALSSAKEGE